MKILLIGEVYSTNLGDPVLCETVEGVIRDAYPDAEITRFDLSGKIDRDSYYAPKEHLAKYRWFARLSYRLPFLCKISTELYIYNRAPDLYMRIVSMLERLLNHNKFDLAIFAGGSIFMDYFAGSIRSIVKMLSKAQVRVMFHACGMSTLSNESQRLIGQALKHKNVKWISLRDSYQRFCGLFKTKAIVTETCDTALLCSSFFCPSSVKKATYGIGVINNPKYYSFQKQLIQRLMSTAISWKLFTNGSQSDIEFAQRIKSELGLSADRICDHPASSESLVKTVTQFDNIISFRMHSQIIAASYGIPCFGFVWDDKIKEFYQKIGYPNNCIVPEDDIDMKLIIGISDIDGKDLRYRAEQNGLESRECLLEGIKCTIKSKR